MSARRRDAAPAGAPPDARRPRLDAARESLRERFEEPVERATRLTRKTLAWFPIRVWRHFLQHNGFLLAAGVSYQALFAIFAALYLAFAVVGVWLGGSKEAVDRLIGLINDYVPGLIGEHGLVKVDQVEDVVRNSTGLFSVTGAIALLALVWTAIGYVTFARRAVRDTFGLPFDSRSYVTLKARDFVAALAYGIALLVGAALGQIGTWALHLVFRLFGWDVGTEWFNTVVRILTIVVAFAINAAALAGLFRFLTGASLRWERIWPGSLLGGAAIVVLQIGAGFLLSYTPSNPLLATFAVFIGVLLWFRLNGVVLLVAAAWIAVSTADRHVPLVEVTEAERRAAEHAALVTAARVRVREARVARDRAPWWSTWTAVRALRRAERALGAVEAAAPPDPARRAPGSGDGAESGRSRHRIS